MRKIFVRASGLAIATSLMAFAATPASAAPTTCSVALKNLTNPDALACVYQPKNTSSNSDADIQLQKDAVAALGGGYTFDGNFDGVTKITSLANGNQLNFGQKLFGQTIIAAHFGNPVTVEQNVTAFWLLDLGSAGVNFVSLDNPGGFSNAVLYTTGAPPAVPEPATWLMMIAGFGAIGFGLRKARRTRISVRYA